jgi:hypothetical protein
MKEQDSLDILWLQAKSLPPELSVDRVNLIIANLPNLPVESNWINHLFTKSTIMTSVSITLIISAVLSLNYFQPKQEIAEKGIELNQELPEATNEDYLYAVPTIQAPTDSVPKQSEVAITQAQKVLPLEAIQEAQITLTDSVPTTQAQELAFPTTLPSEKLTQSTAAYPQRLFPNSPSQGSIFAIDSVSQLQMVGSTDYESLDGRYSDLPIGKIKKSLRRSLSKDKLIPNRNSTIRIELPGDKIIVNGKALTHPLYQKYEDMLQSWGIVNGPHHEIRISPKYIMIGDFAPNGFSGRARGRDMELKFKEDNQQGLFDN